MATLRRKLRRARGFSNVRGVIFFAQRRVLDPGMRRRLARFVARFLPAASLPGDRGSRAASTLERDGFVRFDGILTPPMVQRMREHLSKQLVYNPYQIDGPRLAVDDPSLPDTHVLTVVDEGLMTCPHLLEVANHPDIVAAIERTFGCKPTIGYMAAWWSIPTPDGVPRQAENFHRDFDDVAFLKLFTYLSDVGPENGPHDFILGSHADSQLRPIRRYTDNEVYSTFSSNRLVRFTGGAGTMFLEDTTGLHRGLPVNAGRRLILQIVYSMLPMAYGPSEPYPRDVFQSIPTAIDPYINRIYVRQS
jgi:hypothetical protein